MDKDMEQFKADLLTSVRQMKRGEAVRKTSVAISPVAMARNKSGLSQAQFAHLMGVSVRTLQAWEQGKRNPSGAAQTLLRVAEEAPNILRKLAV